MRCIGISRWRNVNSFSEEKETNRRGRRDVDEKVFDEQTVISHMKEQNSEDFLFFINGPFFSLSVLVFTLPTYTKIFYFILMLFVGNANTSKNDWVFNKHFKK